MRRSEGAWFKQERSGHASLAFPDRSYYLLLTGYLYRSFEEPLQEHSVTGAAYADALEGFYVLGSSNLGFGPGTT